MTVEKARPEDWAAIRDICCRTAYDGKGVGPERRPAFGEHWTGPYREHASEWAYVGVGSPGRRVAGYLTGSPDSTRLPPPSRPPFDEAFLREVYREFPAHLHVNVDEASRGSGLGARLVERFVSDLRAAGVPGVHLFCSAAPKPFYEKQGFRVRAPAGKVFCMTRAL